MKAVAKAIFPLDDQLAIASSVYSCELSKQMVWLSSLLPYRECSWVFERIGERQIPASSIWRQMQSQGEKLQEDVKYQREQVRVERVVLPDA